ncbi:hypothetical protein [Nesterenkonia muleiensis]|uniref:hypothetical protein n=1 Tax=Nesterenkonia muleiensis TaxID=2282648 RepID=UPI000E76F5A1|nr:hypothetical protein [Nesterenkonia muleiensis]
MTARPASDEGEDDVAPAVRDRRVSVRGPQTPPTLDEVLGDPRRGFVAERARAEQARSLRRRQLRLNIVTVGLLAVLLVGMGVGARYEGILLTLVVYPLMVLLALWALRRARGIETL